MSKRVLITGGAGSIGAHVIIHVCHNTDWDIVLLNSFHHKGYKDRLNEIYRAHPEWKSRITEFQHNLTCPISKELKEQIGHIDYIWHLAAMSDVGFSIENPVWTIQNNINSTLVMLELARELKPEQFLYFSTDEVYGPVERKEDGTLGAHKEWDTHRPSNPYSASKAASEDLCYAYWRAYGVPLIITNTMNNVGEAQGRTKFPAMVQSRVEKGETVTIHGKPGKIGSRFYIHSRNVADALLFILKQGVHYHEPGKLDEPHKYHIVGNKQLNNLEMAQMIARFMGKELKYEFQDFHKDNPAHDIHYGMVDTKLKQLGWTPPVSLEESMKKTIEWQTEHPNWI